MLSLHNTNVAAINIEKEYHKIMKEGKYIDVSDISRMAENIRIVDNPPTNIKTTTRWIPPVRVLSNNFSNYARALQLLSKVIPLYEHYIERFKYYYGTGDSVPRGSTILTETGEIKDEHECDITPRNKTDETLKPRLRIPSLKGVPSGVNTSYEDKGDGFLVLNVEKLRQQSSITPMEMNKSSVVFNYAAQQYGLSTIVRGAPPPQSNPYYNTTNIASTIVRGAPPPNSNPYYNTSNIASTIVRGAPPPNSNLYYNPMNIASTIVRGAPPPSKKK